MRTNRSWLLLKKSDFEQKSEEQKNKEQKSKEQKNEEQKSEEQKSDSLFVRVSIEAKTSNSFF